VYVCKCVCIYVCMYVCSYVLSYVCMHVCMYVGSGSIDNKLKKKRKAVNLVSTSNGMSPSSRCNTIQ